MTGWCWATNAHRAEIRSGIIIPAKGGFTVQLQRGMRPAVELRVADEEDGRAILRNLGLGATQTVASFRGMSQAHASRGRTAATVLVTMAAGGALAASLSALLDPAAAIPTILGAILLLLVLTLAPTRIDVGADGVLLRWLGRKRFVGHADIEGVEARVVGSGSNRRATVQLALSSGETFVLLTSPATYDLGRCQGIARRIRAARDSLQSGESVHAEALIGRGERNHVDWVKALRDPDAHVSLRRAPVPRQRLWRIVEDVAVEPLERAVAAVSLGQRLDGEDRARLQHAAAATAAPRLRIALDAVANGADNDTLGEVLEELEADVSTEVERRARV